MQPNDHLTNSPALETRNGAWLMNNKSAKPIELEDCHMTQSHVTKSRLSSELRDDDRPENSLPAGQTENEVIAMKMNHASKNSQALDKRDGALVEEQHPAQTDHNEVFKMKKNHSKGTAPLISISKGTAVNIDGTWMCLAHDAIARIIEDEAMRLFPEEPESQPERDKSVIERPQPSQEEDGSPLGEILKQHPQAFYLDDVLDEIEETELLGITLPEWSDVGTTQSDREGI